MPDHGTFLGLEYDPSTGVWRKTHQPDTAVVYAGACVVERQVNLFASLRNKTPVDRDQSVGVPGAQQVVQVIGHIDLT